MNRRHGGIIPAVVMVLSLATAVQADLMPISDDGVMAQGDVCALHPTSPKTDLDLSLPVSSARALVFDVVALPVEAESDRGQSSSLRPLVDRSNSLDLCLYALIGLGVFRSGHWVKRSSFGLIPDWYHSGAPQQIGHSRVVGPDAFCLAAACFVQPQCGIEKDSLRHGLAAIVSLCRQSQFTPHSITYRGPPCLAT